jgi:hypothetical protein
MKLLIAIAAVVSSAPLVAAVASGDQAAPKQERQICRRVDSPSGTHMSRTRVCHTAREWNAMRDVEIDDVADSLSTRTASQPQPTQGMTDGRGPGPNH